MNRLNKLSGEELRKELKVIVDEYRMYPKQITQEIENEFTTRAWPYLEELNKRAREIWEKKGGKMVAPSPSSFTFRKIIAHGI